MTLCNVIIMLLAFLCVAHILLQDFLKVTYFAIPSHTALDEPRNVQIEGVGATVLYVSWKAPANNGGRPIINYSVTLNELPFFIVEVGSDTFSLLIRNAGLTENTTYTYVTYIGI